jgi:hypothetical protein
VLGCGLKNPARGRRGEIASGRVIIIARSCHAGSCIHHHDTQSPAQRDDADQGDLNRLESPLHRDRQLTSFPHTYPPPQHVTLPTGARRPSETILAPMEPVLCKILDANFREHIFPDVG